MSFECEAYEPCLVHTCQTDQNILSVFAVRFSFRGHEQAQWQMLDKINSSYIIPQEVNDSNRLYQGHITACSQNEREIQGGT